MSKHTGGEESSKFCGDRLFQRSKSRSPIQNNINRNELQECSNESTEAHENQEQNHRINLETTPQFYGPSLPPALFSSKCQPPTPSVVPEIVNTKIYGPTLPSSFGDGLNTQECSINDVRLTYTTIKQPDNAKENDDIIKENENLECRIFGPHIPHSSRAEANLLEPCTTSELSEDDECYGPLPPNTMLNSKAHVALEERALEMKLGYMQTSKEDGAVRETWMIELPEVHSRNLGLGPRQFRASAGPDLTDRSSWTDIPQDKSKKGLAQKIDLKQEAKIKQQEKYDREQEKAIKKYKKGLKEKTLLDIHRAMLDKKGKKEEQKRRPFNRETDLKVNYLDAVQKEAILKKSALLNDRFVGGHSKYL